MDLVKDYEEFYKLFAEYVDSNFNDIERWIGKSDFLTVLARFPYNKDWNCSLFIWILEAVNLLGEFSRDSISRTLAEVFETLQKKNADYGNAAFDFPILTPETPVSTALLCRLSDKVNRYMTLKDKEAEVQETISDTLKDFIGYVIILWLVTFCDGYEDTKADDTDRLVMLCPSGIKFKDLLEQIENRHFVLVQSE